MFEPILLVHFPSGAFQCIATLYITIKNTKLNVRILQSLMFSKPHVHSSNGWQLSPYFHNHTGRTDSSVSFSKMAIVGKDKLSVGRFSKSPDAVVFSVISNIPSMHNSTTSGSRHNFVNQEVSVMHFLSYNTYSQLLVA